MDISINLFVKYFAQSLNFYRAVFGASIKDEQHFQIRNQPFALAEVKRKHPEISRWY